MTETRPKRLRKEDCRIDWKNYPSIELDGSISYGDASDSHDDWLEDDCGGDESSPINKEKCIAYYEFEYDKKLIKQYERQEGYDEYIIAFWGLQHMFNDGWIKDPAFVNWKELYSFISPHNIQSFVEGIFERKKGVEILKYLNKMADTIYPSFELKEIKKELKILISKFEAGAKIQAQQAAEEQKKNRPKKEKPDFTITLDEIIDYAENENPDSAPMVRAMLRYFKDTKDGWDTTAIKKKINAIGDKGTTTINNVEHLSVGDNVQTKIINQK